ncbi:hypothetical protein CHARACLAT_003513 [Characodon lateralis]|uniref:Uncharacterized protein n=1 Tax=Characodon lateralis TaxID=208331 RepID=A0ABU7D3S5_9TELE|nr:hypothetical protein [Characodon lateralis]
MRCSHLCTERRGVGIEHTPGGHQYLLIWIGRRCSPVSPAACYRNFHSHQIFHVLVVAAAFIHFYGVSNLQEFRYGLEGGCTDDSLL